MGVDESRQEHRLPQVAYGTLVPLAPGSVRADVGELAGRVGEHQAVTMMKDPPGVARGEDLPPQSERVGRGGGGDRHGSLIASGLSRFKRASEAPVRGSLSGAEEPVQGSTATLSRRAHPSTVRPSSRMAKSSHSPVSLATNIIVSGVTV